MKASVFFIAFAILASSSLILYKSATQTASADTFVIGTAAGYAPFVSVNQEGIYEGFDIDVAQALAAEMGKKLEIKDLGSMTSLFLALEQGSIDGIIWGLSITQERLKKVAMIRYQGELTKAYSMIFWKEIPASIKTINDMQGMIVCVEPTSAQDSVLDNYPFIKKKATEKVDDALLNIQYGKADAAFVEPAIARKFQKKYPEIKILAVELSPEDQVQGMGIALKRSNTKLADQVRTAVQTLTRNGIIKTFQDRWGVE